MAWYDYLMLLDLLLIMLWAYFYDEFVGAVELVPFLLALSALLLFFAEKLS